MSDLYCTDFLIAGDKDKLKQLAEALDKYDSIEDVAKALSVELDSDTYDTDLTTIYGVEVEKDFLSFAIDDTSYIPYDALDEICDEIGGGLKVYFQENPVQIPTGRVRFDKILMSRPNYDAGWGAEKYGMCYEVDDFSEKSGVFKTLKDIYEFIKEDLRRKGDEDSIAEIEEAWETEADDPDEFISTVADWQYLIAQYDMNN